MALALMLSPHAMASTATMNVDLSTSVSAFDLIDAGCLTIPPGGIGPANYSYGTTSFTSGASPGNHVFEVVGLGAADDPGLLLYQGSNAFNPASPATNYVDCKLSDGLVDPSYPRLVSSLAANTTYTVVVIVPKNAPSGTLAVTLGLGLEPTIDFDDKTVQLGAVGEFLSATSNSPTAFAYSSGLTFIATVDASTGEITTVDDGSTDVTVTQPHQAGADTYGSGKKSATLNVSTGTPATVTSPTSSAVTASSATLGGNVSSDGGSTITERGVVYALTSQNANPSVGGPGVTELIVGGGTGTFTAEATGLAGSSGYSFKAYATNSAGTAYSTVATFTTLAAPTVTAPTFATVTTNSATLGGNVTAPGSSALIERGVVLVRTLDNLNPPVIGGPGVTKLVASGTSTGVFTLPATSLLHNTQYAFRAYASNSAGTGYSATGTFTTTTQSGSAVTFVQISANPLIANGPTTITASFIPTTELTGGHTIAVKLADYIFAPGPITITPGAGFIGAPDAVLTGVVNAGALDTVEVTVEGATYANASAQASFTFPATNPGPGQVLKTRLQLSTSQDPVPVAAEDHINLNIGPKSKLAFVRQPVGAGAGVDFATQPQVAIQDANGNQTLDGDDITLTIDNATNPDGAILTCTGGIVVAAVDGLATFSGCSIDKLGTYTLIASALGVADANSNSIFNNDPEEIEFVEGDLAAALFGTNALGLVSGQFGGDTQPDLALLREDDSIALWLRDTTQKSGFRLAPAFVQSRAFGSALYFAMLSLDAHGDGGGDLGFITKSSASNPDTHIGALLNQGPSWNPSRTIILATASADSPQVRRLRRIPQPGGGDQMLALDGTESARLYEVPLFSAIDLVAEFAHSGGAFDAVPVFYGDNSEPPALLTLGAPPQRLWRYVSAQNAYVEQPFSGIDREVRQAVSLSLAPGTDPRIVTVSDQNKVEVWTALPPAQAGGPPAGYTLLADLTAPGAPQVNFVDTIDLAPGARFHLLVGVDGEEDSTQTRVYRATQGVSGDGITHTETWQGGLSFVRSGDAAFVSDRNHGIRSYVPRVVPPPGPPLPITVKLNPATYYGHRGLLSGDPTIFITVEADVAVDRNVFLTLNNAYPVFLPKGQRTGTTRYWGASLSGTAGISLQAPASDPLVTLGSPSTGQVIITDFWDELEAICAALTLSGMPLPGKGQHDDPDTFLPPAELQILRDFRDQVLSETLAGREFVALYYHFSHEFFTSMFATPTFFLTAVEAKQAWMPVFAALAQGDGSAIVTADMLALMDQVFEHYRQYGSRELREAIEFHYPRLDPHAFEGKSAGELFDHLVGLPPMQGFKSGFEEP